MPEIGTIACFDESIEDFETYCSRVDFYFEANKVAAAEKKAVFVTLLGSKLFSLTQDLLSPKTLNDATHAEIVAALKKHFKPKKVVIYERYKFHTRSQAQGESIAEFVVGLKSCARTCEFGEALDDMLRDRFVVGLLDEATQRTLLTELDLTFNKAVSVASARETAAKDVREMGRRTTIHAVGSAHTNKFKPNNGANNSIPNTPCTGCGKLHWRKDCPWKDKECFKCHMKGHLKKYCKNTASSPPKAKYSKKKYSQSTSKVSVTENRQDDEYNYREDKTASGYDNFIFRTSESNSVTAPITKQIFMNNLPITMELDTGATRSLMSNDAYISMFRTSRPTLRQTNIMLHAYGGLPLNVIGEIKVKISTSPEISGKDTTIIVVQGSGPALMGRDLLSLLNISSFSINRSSAASWVSLFPELFSPGLGCFTESEVSLSIDNSVAPKYCKARPVPYTLREKVDAELKRLEEENIITAVSFSEWAAATVPVVKSNGSIRLCGDYKLTVNRALNLDTYPIPRLEDLLSSLAGAKIFSKLDMSQAYAQLRIDDRSKQYTTINTHRGLFQYNRLPFGVSSAPGIFQRTMEGVLGDLSGVLCYLDDILMWGSTEQEHDERVTAVLSRLQDKGLKLQASKCAFRMSEMSYLGYIISNTGIKTDPSKVQAINDAPSPTSVKQLQAFLGSIGFYRRFLPSFSTVVEPLNILLRAKTKWVWGKEQERAFRKAKDLLLNSEALMLFDPKLPLVVVADSSAYGIGAVLCHKVGKLERPICFASRSLTSAERNYSQLEKEALAMVFAMNKFHNYLWGQQFTLVTDHKPLLGIFSPEKAIPPMASGRVQRWALVLQAYRFKLIHRSGAVLGTADALSRLPLPNSCDSVPVLGEWINLVNFLESAPVTSKTISVQTRTDPILSKVLRYCELGWPASSPDPVFAPYFSRRDELSMEGGCVLWGYRMVIPMKLRPIMLDEIHAGHVGASRMKEIARSYFWWPGLDKDLEVLVRSCPKCLSNRSMPPRAEIHPWEWPKHPWHRLHLDYAGPIRGKFYLILVDAHSKWVEIFPTRGPSASETVKCLRHCFSQFGLPVSVVSDNGTCFTSSEFQTFLANNGIRHSTTAVYKPSTNGLAERMVRTFKEALSTTEENMEVFLDKFLFKYRSTPHATTGVSPAELLLKRRLRCRLDLLFPMEQVEDRVVHKQQMQQASRRSRRSINVSPGDSISVRNYASGPSWLPAEITKQTGPVSYECRLPSGQTLKRHQDQIYPTDSQPITGEVSLEGDVTSPNISSPNILAAENIPPAAQPQSNEQVAPPMRLAAPEVASPALPDQTLRRSSRIKRPVDRLNL